MQSTEFNRETDTKVTGAVRNISLQELIQKTGADHRPTRVSRRAAAQLQLGTVGPEAGQKER